MDCSLIEADLIGFHFGTLDDGPRRAVEAHLVECPGCVRAYLVSKRTLEAGMAGLSPAQPLVPSDAARARLRAAVADELRTLMRRRQWGRRLAMPLAIAAALVLALALGNALRHPAPRSPTSLPEVDAVNSASLSLDVL